MALKDKLMTLEDFKAVRDVDVASNSAQFTEIKTYLDALEEEVEEVGLSGEAKQALLDCLSNVAWKSESAKQTCYEALSEALGFSDFYNTWEWDSRSTGANKVYRINTSSMSHSDIYGIDIIDSGLSSNTRRSFGVLKGKYPMVNRSNGEATIYYPIPVPYGANKVTVTVTPNTQLLATYLFKSIKNVDSSGYNYSFVGPSKTWQTGIDVTTFEPDKNLFIAFNMKKNASDSKYTDATEPEINILFEEV